MGFVGTIYLARSLGAAPLGVFGLSVSIMGWLRVSDLGVTQATVKRISEGENQSEVISTSLIIQTVQTVIVVAGLVVLRDPINEYIGGEFVLIIGGLFVINRLVNGTARQILRGYRVAHIANGLNAADRTLRTVFQVILVAAGFGVMGLFLGMGAAFVIIGAAAVITIYSIVDFTLKFPTWSTFLSLIHYAKYSVLGVVKSEAFSWTDIIVLGFFVENAVIGVYNVSWSIAMAFLLFGNAMRQNLFPEVSGISSEGASARVRELISESFVYVGVLPIAGVVGAALLGQQVLSIYGPEFTRGGTVLTILVLVALLRSYESQIHAMLDGIDRPDLTFRLNVVFTVTNIALNLVLIPLYGAVGAAVATATAVGLNVGLGWWLSTELVDIRLPIVEIGKQVTAALLMGTVVFGAMTLVNEGEFIYTVALIMLGAAVYFGALLALSAEIRTKAIELGDGIVG